MSVDIETSCAHCDETLHIELDSRGDFTVREAEADPLLFQPEIDWERFDEPTIIHDY